MLGHEPRVYFLEFVKEGQIQQFKKDLTTLVNGKRSIKRLSNQIEERHKKGR